MNIRVPAILVFTITTLACGMERSATPNSSSAVSSPKATNREDILVSQAFKALEKRARKNSALSPEQIRELQQDWQETASAVGDVSVDSNIEELEIVGEEITPDDNAGQEQPLH